MRAQWVSCWAVDRSWTNPAAWAAAYTSESIRVGGDNAMRPVWQLARNPEVAMVGTVEPDRREIGDDRFEAVSDEHDASIARGLRLGDRFEPTGRKDPSSNRHDDERTS